MEGLIDRVTMQLRIAALADYTNITETGKLNILGIFSQIHAAQVPAVHAQMQLVLQFAFDPLESGEKHIQIILQDEDGHAVLTADGTLQIASLNQLDPIVVNQILVLQNVVFPHFGSYEFVLLVNGETIPAHVPVDVLPAPQAAQS